MTKLNQSITPACTPLEVGTLFAVYGTLRKGGGNDSSVGMASRAEFVGKDTVQGTLYHLGGFPGLTDETSETPVVVEVYKVVDSAMSLTLSLDTLEGYVMGRPQFSMYIRAEVTLDSGAKAQIYYYNSQPPKQRIIKSGDWFNQG